MNRLPQSDRGTLISEGAVFVSLGIAAVGLIGLSFGSALGPTHRPQAFSHITPPDALAGERHTVARLTNGTALDLPAGQPGRLGQAPLGGQIPTRPRS